MRNVVIGVVVVVVLGVAGGLGWMVWQNVQSEGSAATADSTPLADEGAFQDVSEAGDVTAESTAPDDQAGGAMDASGLSAWAERLQFVYLWNQRLEMWGEGETWALAAADQTHPPAISHDGSLVAFVRDDALWVMSAQGGQERLLVSASEIETMGTDELTARLHRFAWLPDSHELLFNTALNMEMGFVLTDDLYAVEVDSLALEQLLPPGEGGEFHLSPDGEAIAVSAPERVRIVDRNGTDVVEPLSFPAVMTYSSFAYYPQPVWAADSHRVALVIPHAEGWIYGNAPAQVWLMAVGEGEAGLQGELSAGTPNFWIDPTLQRVAYMQQDAPEDAEPGDSEASEDASEESIVNYSVQIAGLDGADVATRYEGQGQFMGWSPDGARFLVSVPGAVQSLFIGAMGDEELTPVDGLHYVFGHQIVWLDDAHFLVTGADSEETTVSVVAADGSLSRLLRLDVPGLLALDVAESLLEASR